MRNIEYSTEDGRPLSRLESYARVLVRHRFARRTLLVSGLINGLMATICAVTATADALRSGRSALVLATVVLAVWFALRAGANWVVARSVPRST
ncbi:MAG: hypothetical protein AAFP84_18430 [Actinomycetota bacterium]